MDGWMGGWMDEWKSRFKIAIGLKKAYLHKKTKKNGLVHIKNSPLLSWKLHKIGANVWNNLAVPPFHEKKYGPGWVGGWVVEPF